MTGCDSGKEILSPEVKEDSNHSEDLMFQEHPVPINQTPLPVEKPAPKGEFVCSTCKATFVTRRYIKFHQKIHNKVREIFTCDECPRIYYHARNLNQHKKTAHEGMKPKCSFCDQKFSTKQKLNLHMKIHDPLYINEAKMKKESKTKKKFVKYMFSANSSANNDKDFEFIEKKKRKPNKKKSATNNSEGEKKGTESNTFLRDQVQMKRMLSQIIAYS